MEVLIDIPEATKPIIRKTFKMEDKKAAELREAKAELDHLLNELILLIEGFYKFIPTLHKDKVKHMLDNTAEAVPKMDSADERLKSIRYLNDTDLKEKFRYALKLLYKLKAVLHVAYYKDKPVLKTQMYIKEGLSKISLEAVSTNLMPK